MGETPIVDPASNEWELAVRDRLLARDPSVLSDLYDQFGSYVFGLAARGIGDRPAAEDVTQEVFMTIWERPEAFEPARGRLRTFLGTLAHRRSVDVVRREEARRRRAARHAATTMPIPDVGDLAMAIYTAEQVRAEVNRLPADQRAAI